MIKLNLVIFAIFLWNFVSESKTIPIDRSVRMIQRDSVTPFDIIVPEDSGELILYAIHGIGVGPNIKYMPEWQAFGFFREGNHIEWKLKVKKTKKYKVYLEWSAEGSVVGNPYVFSIGKRSLERKVKDSGSWETFKEEPIGVLKIKKGEHKVVFRPGEAIEKGGGMLDVKTIRLVPE